MSDSTRILVTGANGQVGHELLRALAGRLRDGIPPPLRGDSLPVEGGEPAGVRFHPLRNEGGRASARGDVEPPREIIPATRTGSLEDGSSCERMDLADLDTLPHALDRIAPDLIINAAAYTAVDRAEDEPELAQRINGDALGVIGAWAKRHDARVVHYSTDYVFDGSATRPYREDDATHPVSAYGRSKLAGETALRGSGARHLILRTAWVYAARGHNFLRTMLRLGAERDALRVVDDQLGAPTPAGLIADVTARVVAGWHTPPSTGRGGATANAPKAWLRRTLTPFQGKEVAVPAESRHGGGMPTLDGTYHLVASGQTSWCDFARAIFERAQRAGLITRAPHVEAIRTADYPTRAARPAYSVLDTSKLRAAFGVTLPDWKAALDGVMDEVANVGS
ncbi:MAG TPA: dTDP-4-dehydrorhamnose reductase [Rhodanobacteraceae bacterium]|nr:dTDP-4-dehydrorhamnose reductase [Rhodanobacteraceae bacterium]